MEFGAHVFVEKPLGVSVSEARKVVDLAVRRKRKLLVGYTLRQSPVSIRFIELARGLGKPLVMRMNLNQQSFGASWNVHKHLMETASPIVDCGVHSVDVMCQMTGSRPVRVQAIDARLSDELKPGMYNYGQLQLVFEDGSVGWYEAGWGPMASETGYAIKDVWGPRGSVSIVKKPRPSADITAHGRSDGILIHHAEGGSDGNFVRRDELIDTSDAPDHQEICRLEQAFLVRAIREDIDLTDRMEAAVQTLRIVLAADESVRTGRAIDLSAQAPDA